MKSFDYFKTLVPDSVLKVYPRPRPGDGPQQKTEWNDFVSELHRMKELVDRVPKSTPKRLLDLACRNMTEADRNEFRRLGNELLVSKIHFPKRNST